MLAHEHFWVRYDDVSAACEFLIFLCSSGVLYLSLYCFFQPLKRKKLSAVQARPQILPSDLTPDICSSEKAPLVKKCTRGRAKKTMPGSPRLELLKGALSKSPKLPSEPKAPVDSSEAAEVVTPRACPLLMRQNIRHSLSTLLCRRSENVSSHVFIQTLHFQKTNPVN